MILNEALFCCVKRTHALKNIENLIARGAEPWAVDDKGRTLLHYAAEQGNVKLINHFIRKFKINPNVSDYYGQTAMHMAATQFYGSVITALVNAGGDVNATDKTGVRPLHIAAVHGHIPVACKLIKKGADITAQTYAVKRGYGCLTAKEAAIMANQTEMAEILENKEQKRIREMMEQSKEPVFICSHDNADTSVKARERENKKA